jgi:hypothetical protein
MAFTPATLSRIAHAAGNNVFLYKTTDAETAVVAANYFDPSANEFMQGDIIIAACVGVTKGVEMLMVTSTDRAATVTVVAEADA